MATLNLGFQQFDDSVDDDAQCQHCFGTEGLFGAKHCFGTKSRLRCQRSPVPTLLGVSPPPQRANTHQAQHAHQRVFHPPRSYTSDTTLPGLFAEHNLGIAEGMSIARARACRHSK